jgi:hypothetical protein
LTGKDENQFKVRAIMIHVIVVLVHIQIQIENEIRQWERVHAEARFSVGTMSYGIQRRLGWV